MVGGEASLLSVDGVSIRLDGRRQDGEAQLCAFDVLARLR